MQTYISHNENDTKNLAMEIAKKLHTGDIIVLTGELGSGKTKFTECFLSYFHLEKEISSPTSVSYTHLPHLTHKEYLNLLILF